MNKRLGHTKCGWNLCQTLIMAAKEPQGSCRIRSAGRPDIQGQAMVAMHMVSSDTSLMAIVSRAY